MVLHAEIAQPVRRGRGRPVADPNKPPTDAVRLARLARGWNQEQLAHHLGCSLSTVRYAERHRQLPNHKELLKRFTMFAQSQNVALDAIDPEREVQG